MRISLRCLWALGALALAACGDGGGSKTTTVIPAPAPGGSGNRAPVFAGGAAANFNENSTMTAYIAVARDADGDTVLYSLAGPDAANFTVNTVLGQVEFVTPPDFELPDDADRDNVYEITIIGFDGTARTRFNVTISVNDVGEFYEVVRRGTGFTQPVFLTGAGDGSGRVFVVERGGLIRILDPDTNTIKVAPYLNVSGDVDITTGEDGLLGLAFAPDYAVSGEFYIFIATLAGDVEIRRYTVSGANPDIADAASEELIFSFAHPSQSHFGGWLGFGPDGYLYFAVGDSDAAVNAANPAQDTASYLGKLMRIDPAGDDFPPAGNGADYAIPATNPFAAGGGNPEIYARGLRNPFRASFDGETGYLFVGDVGEDTREEIDLLRPNEPGRNFGWVRFEGTDILVPAASAPSSRPPVLQYNHGAGAFEGGSVTGGSVNRGPVHALSGFYIFGDYLSKNIWALPARDMVPGSTLNSSALTRLTDDFDPAIGDIDRPVCFCTDEDGYLYILDIMDGEIYRMERL